MGQINSKTRQIDNNSTETESKKISPRRKMSTPKGGQYLNSMLEDQEKRRKEQERRRKLMNMCGGCLSCFAI